MVTLGESVADGKSSIASAITSNGVYTDSSASFNTMTTNINTMASKKATQGVIDAINNKMTSSTFSGSMYFFTCTAKITSGYDYKMSTQSTPSLRVNDIVIVTASASNYGYSSTSSISVDISLDTAYYGNNMALLASKYASQGTNYIKSFIYKVNKTPAGFYNAMIRSNTRAASSTYPTYFTWSYAVIRLT